MRRYLSYLTILLGALFWVVPVNATQLLDESESDDAEFRPYTPKEICDLFECMTFPQQQEFCNRIAVAKEEVNKKLHLPLKTERVQISFKEVSDLLSFYENNKEALRPVFSREISKINFHPFTVEEYLEFCFDISPKKSYSSMGSSYSNQDVQTILHNLELDADPTDPNVISLARNLKRRLKFPLNLSPFDLLGFSMAFNDLKKKEKESKEPSLFEEKLKPRHIANYIASLSFPEKKVFCEKISEINASIQNDFFPYSLPEQCPNWSGAEYSLPDIKLILSAIRTFPSDLGGIRDFTLWVDTSTNQKLTLKNFLTFYVEMNPRKREQIWIPFVQLPRSLHHQNVLQKLVLPIHGQQDWTIQKRIRKLQTQLGDPFSFHPLKIGAIAKEYEKLRDDTKFYQRSAFNTENVEDWIRNHAVPLSLSVGLSLTSYFFWE